MTSTPQRTTKQRYSKVPEIAASPIDENSDHEYDREHGFGDDNNSVEFTTNPSLSADVKRSLYLSERASSKEIKYLQDERFGDKNQDVDDTTFSEESSQHHHYLLSKIHCILTTNLVNDETLLQIYRRICCVENGTEVDDGGTTLIKLIKLIMGIIICILITHSFARWMQWETDPNYSISDFYMYDFTTVLLDVLFFFVVGRMYSQEVNIDTLFPWGIFISLGCIYPSVANDFAFLRHSLSMYEVMCNWPMILFIYVAALLVLAAMLVVGLIRSHYRRGILLSRCFEAAALASVFILPYASNNNFHLHHWFGMWLLGMLCNAPEWWSRSFQAYSIGCYINGIAVYGRDPILGCNLAFYRSTNANCDYMSCYEEPGGNGTHHYKPFVAPDWRTCNAPPGIVP